MRKNAKNRNISWFEGSRTRGWWVRISRDRKIRYQKLFSVKRYGGRQEALRAARRWRDEKLQALEMNLSPAKPCITRIRFTAVRRKGRVIGYQWTAWRCEKGRRRIRSWSASAHGYEAAWRKAVSWACENESIKHMTVPRAPKEYRQWVEQAHAKNLIRGINLRFQGKRCYWMVCVSINGERVSRSFSVRKWGFWGGYHKAVSANCKLRGIPLPHRRKIPNPELDPRIIDRLNEMGLLPANIDSPAGRTPD